MNMTTTNCRTPFVIRFMDTKPRVLLELTNTTELTLKSIEILTIFLKDEGPAAGSSRAHIRFDRINSVQPNGKAVISHRTSWEDLDGKIQFQRTPVGH